MAPKRKCRATKAKEQKERMRERRESKMGKSKIDESKMNESKIDEPKMNESKIDEPKMNESKIDESKMNESKIDESKIDESKMNESKIDESKMNESKIDESKMDEPIKSEMNESKKSKMGEPTKSKLDISKKPKSIKDSVSKISESNIVQESKSGAMVFQESKIDETKIDNSEMGKSKMNESKMDEPIKSEVNEPIKSKMGEQRKSKMNIWKKSKIDTVSKTSESKLVQESQSGAMVFQESDLESELGSQPDTQSIAMCDAERQKVCDELLLGRNNLELPQLLIQGSFHQGNFRFGNNAGKQCVANCLAAIAHSSLRHISTWDQYYLDNILVEGNELYSWIHGSNDLLLVSDLPSEIEIANMMINCTKKESYAALLNVNNLNLNDFPGVLPLDQALQDSLIGSDGCFISVLGFTSIAIKQNNRLYLFDSHARNAYGLQDVFGASVVMELESVEYLYQLLCKFVNYNTTSQFEVTGISVLSDEIQHMDTCNIGSELNDELIEFQDIETLDNISKTENVEVEIINFEEQSMDQTDESFSDVIIGGISRKEIFDFTPANVKLRQKLCAMLRIPRNHVSKAGSYTAVIGMGPPTKTKSIHGDGNCLFRAVSCAVSQRQKYHSQVRIAIVEHILSNKDKFESFTSPLSVEEHITRANMANDNSWGTATEIVAAADFLKTDIFTYSDGKWVKYSAHQIDPNCNVNEMALYLNHCENHYEVVTGVKQTCQDTDCFPSYGKKRKSEYECTSVIKKSKAEKEKEKYYTNADFRHSKILKERERYGNEQFSQNQKKQSRTRYETDEIYRTAKKEATRHRYVTDDIHRQSLIQAGINKYASNETYRQNLVKAGVNKYASDESYRQKLKDASKRKYSVDKTHKEKIQSKNRKRRSKQKDLLKNIDNVIDQFRLEAKKGPEYVCSCCFRVLFENQVLLCNEDVYNSKGEIVRGLAQKCISYRYLHCCSTDCAVNCPIRGTSRTTLWICYTCHRKLLNGQVPAECHANNLDLEEIPDELKKLNKLEQHLVAIHIPFMKVLALPKGGQKGVHGPVVCVPLNLNKITNSLPRSEDENKMLPVKLKRKLSYKGYEEYQYVSTKRLESALVCLSKNNSWYSNVKLSKEWLNPIPEDIENEEVCNFSNVEKECNVTVADEILGLKNEERTTNQGNSDNCVPGGDDISDSYLDDQLQGIQLDTCLQPADIGQEILDQCFDEVFNISPAEGKKPVSVLKEEGIEAKSFPVHYPSGKNTQTEERDYKLSLLRYFNLRLMNVDNRFAKDTSYIFFAQYLSELDRVISNVQIALRKDSPVTSDGQKVTRDKLCDKNYLKDLLKNDQATKYLKPVRGTPPYWQSTQKDIFAMIRQLGIPTFFCSFSSADFRWTEMTETIMKQQGDIRNVEDLDWKEKCKVLNSNPVTLARMFDHRFHAFLHHVILSDAEPIGKVEDYFYRVEFQQRGSPHVHCLFWVEDAPKFSEDDDSDVVQFIDKYISCEIPDKDQDPELNEMVTSLHKHSKNHSKTCKKKSTVCRFNFPRPPSTETFIAKQKELDSNDESDNSKEAEVHHAKQRMSEYWDTILDEANEGMCTKDIQEKVNMTQAEFEDIASVLSQRNTIVLKRQPNEIFINHYNKNLLRAWNANMDIQYVLDAYACVVYIISYISKAERELGLLLQQTKAEAQEGNLNAQQTMRKIGTAYLHHRELSAQEAVFRVTGLKLKQCSRKVEFVPIGENPCRMSVPLKELKVSKTKQGEGDSEDDESVWMTSRVDRYKERPNTEKFVHMCLAAFCPEYDVLSKSQVPQKINQETTFELGKDLGYIRKRTRTKPSIVRYPRFSVEASPEKFYQSILQLFLPYRQNQQLKPPQYETFEEFYNHGYVRYSEVEQMKRVKNIVDNNKSDFVQNEQALEKAERDFEEIGCPENAWGSLCPEAEIERNECIIEGSKCTVLEDDNAAEAIPDLNKLDHSVGTNLLSTVIYPRNEIVPLMRALNTKQRQIFYKIRDWCLQKAQGKKIKPFHVLITGGGGTGKSHLIKCLYYEITRILSRTTENPDEQTVLLTAPTGTAAFNISGLTIHSALGIFKNLSFDHVLLSEDKINTLRSQLESLEVLIIDEISMVNKRMLFFIHQRLRQIKKMPEDCLFGGVSVIAVGDFYQLPPIKTKNSDKLYVNDPSNSMNQLWFDLFEKAELDEIMRQRGDIEFSEILNRFRIRCKKDPIHEDDLQVIRKCVRDGPENALHIFATNKEVNNHNNEMVMKLDTEVKLIETEDFVKDKTSGKLIKKRSRFSDMDIQLPSSLLVAVDARVMLIKNIDTKDGLVNGVMGTVREINQSGVNMPDKIFIIFDNSKVGQNARWKKTIQGDVCIGLEASVEDIPKKNGSRKQFPLKLSWACTVHKDQGLTVQECVIDLNKCFSYGQAYVALSRVTSTNGLYLKNVSEETLKSKIYCDPDVVDGISSMKDFLTSPPMAVANKTVLVYHNIEGLLNHIEDLRINLSLSKIDFVCLTETWMNNNQTCNIEGYQFKHLSRYEAYDSSNEFYSALKTMKNGGVGVFLKNGGNFTEVTVSCRNLECYGFIIPSLNLLVVTIYRTQKYNLQIFLRNFSDYIERILPISENILVCGDFNQDIKKKEIDIERYMQSKGFVQCVQFPTTEVGTLIDHVYIKGLSNVSVSVLPTYYSYHEAIGIQFNH